MNKYFIGLIVLGVLIIASGLIGMGEEVVGETPCVDGYNRVNLEGIMCEDVETTWFGVHDNYYLFLFIPFLLYTILFWRKI